MIIRSAFVEAYQDRTGRYTLFHEAIDHLGIKKYGEGWVGTISRYEPQTIPLYKSQANTQQILFAADFILHYRPNSVITEVHYAGDEAWIGAEKPFDLNINEEDWFFAHTTSSQFYEQQKIRIDELKYILDAFCTLAANKEIKCYARRSDSSDLQDLAPEMWDVGSEVLWSRYTSGCINIHTPFSDVENGRHIILLDTKDVRLLEISDDAVTVESVEDVRAELIGAAIKNPNAAPDEGGKGGLIRSVAQRTKITLKESRSLVDSIPDQAWDKRGRRKKEHKFSDKYIHKG